MARTLVDNLRQQIHGAREFIDGTMADVTPEQAQWQPPGNANPIGAQYAHVLTSEDGIINGLFQQKPPLFASSHAGRAGFNPPPPAPREGETGLPDWHEWAQNVEVDLPQLREYAQAVRAKTDSYLDSLTDADLDTEISHPVAGDTTVGYMLNVAVLNNTHWHCGEISCLKGVQGGKGYPV